MGSQPLRKILVPILLPASFIYGIIASVRNGLFNVGILKSKEFDIPVIAVGNITVGGTGKTPHVEYLLKVISEKYPVAYLSRGYKRNTKGFVLASKESTPQTIGDEAYQVYSKFKHNITVAVDEKRVRGIEKLRKLKPELKCILLDDAYQHRKVKPGVSVLLIDFYRPVQKDFLLPFGNLREKRPGIHRANVVIVTKVPHEIKPIEKRIWIKELNLYPYQFLYFSTFVYGKLTPIHSTHKQLKRLHDFDKKDTSVLLLAGIANPEPLYREVKKEVTHVEKMYFPDHHSYTAADTNRIISRFKAMPGKTKLIVTTEKDAVKLKNMPFADKGVNEKIFYLPIEVHFLDCKGDELDTNILEYVTKSKRISRLHS